MSKTKILITLLIMVIGIFGLATFSNGANEEIAIVKNAESEYIIYSNKYLNKEFEFAFSNEKTADVATLTFTHSALDSQEDGANHIAYVDNATIAMFDNPTYMWIKVDGEVKVSAVEVDLTDNITKVELQTVDSISKVIPVKLEQKQILDEVNEEGTKITETVGVAKISEDITNGEYQIVERKATEETDKFFALAELLEKNEFTNTYTQIKASKEFYEMSKNQLNGLKEENWKKIEEATIEQPKDAETGEQYILYVKSGNMLDMHFLTSYKEYEEEYIKEEIKTKLPYTYDNNIILIAFGIVVALIILVVVRIVILKKKELNK